MPIEKKKFPQIFDAIVVGAGHAGCEAAMALAHLGHETLLLTGNVDRIGHLSCNPAIGGLAKGHMVKEIDALGGMMGLWADEAGIQFRILNGSKGPAVRASRAQIDRDEYLRVVKRDIFAQENLWVKEDCVDDILDKDGVACGVSTMYGQTFMAKHVLLTTGTFLQGRIHVGLNNFAGGRLGDAPAAKLSGALTRLGFELGRLKTGTTPRLLRESINFDAMERQDGDNPPRPFSFCGKGVVLPQLPCYITWTNDKTHEAIRAGFDKSPMFTGVITGTGARYCPSIEDKVARFPEKPRHQIFVEPEGINSHECYPNGIPTSLPLEVQKALLATVVGLEKAEIVRPGYAIEYDYVDPVQLRPTLESKPLAKLWLAGQINGTSGYEEAAAQGLWAALNISCQLRDRAPFILGRDEAYMAVLVDDLVTKGTKEPYRMFTSRAEHRLLLRENNADARLTAIGREIGLVDDARWAHFSTKQEGVTRIISELESRRIRPDAPTRDLLASINEPTPTKAITLADLLRRPSMTLERMLPFWPEAMNATPEVCEEAETQVKYSGYLARQEELVLRSAKSEEKAIPADLDYKVISGLTREVVEKLERVRPLTFGQASRISGITPAALTCIEIQLAKLAKGHK
ncbi:MAG: tRNA uridine-5-carboxymethylaminomethyl(34) synthesis enzyme MnmG [Pseudomonadota bacterium]